MSNINYSKIISPLLSFTSKLLLTFVFLLLTFSFSITIATATTYYISPTGNDSNSGTTPSLAWRTIDKVNNTNFSPGSTILFEGSQQFNGSLNFTSTDTGTEGSPVTLSSYGNNRATILSGASYGIRVTGASYFIIDNINFKGGYDVDSHSGNNEKGVQINNGQGTQHHIRINNVNVSNYYSEGIAVGGHFRDVRITNCRVSDSGLRGIIVHGTNLGDIYIGFCHVSNIPGHLGTNSGDGIRLRGIDSGPAIVEYNVVTNIGWRGGDSSGGPVGIWSYESSNVTIQFNESYGNRSRGHDGGGFDLDGGSKNSVLQYNYSHDNEGAGFLFAQYSGASEFRNNTIRYNISQNDGLKRNYAGILLWNGGTGIRDSEIYNNTIYVSSLAGTQANNGNTNYVMRAVNIISGGIYNVNFRNNIFVTNDNNDDGDHNDVQLIQSSTTSGLRFENNLYHDVTGLGFRIQLGGTYTSLADWRSGTNQETLNGQPVGIQADPLLNNSGQAPTIGDPLLLPEMLPQLLQYYLHPSSPAIDAGLDLQQRFGINPGQQDFYNNPIPHNNLYDIGAHEYSGVVPTPTPTPHPADRNADGVVNIFDLNHVISQFTSLGYSVYQSVITFFGKIL